MRRLILLVVLFNFACTQEKIETAGQNFGDEITIKESTSLATIYQNPDVYIDKEILTEGTITDVCQKKGCWMKISDGKNEMTVRFKDYGFFIPKDAADSHVTIQGYFKAEADEHIEKEASEQKEGEHQEEQDSTAYTFTASAVVITPASDG